MAVQKLPVLSVPDDIAAKVTSGLSPEQRQAVMTKSRFVRIIASAGAGKTETLTRRIVYLLACGVRPDRIVAFTFTEKAAASMKERIYRRVREILGEDACRSLGDTFIGTMHSFAGRILQDHFGFGDHEIMDENEQVAFLLQHGWEIGLDEAARRASSSYGDYCIRFLKSEAVVNDEMLDLSRVVGADGTRMFQDLVERYWDHLSKNRLLTFGRLIRLCAENLERNPGVLSVEHFIVDEYQDINRAQEAMINAIINRPGIKSSMIVGDPRQCIYEWRGSDPECFDRFASVRDTETIQLLSNFRSGSRVVGVANRLAKHFEGEHLRLTMKPSRADEGVSVVVELPKPEDEARWIADQINALVTHFGLRYSDIALLLRSVSTSGEKFAEAFKERGIPYLIGGKLGLFKRGEALAMAAVWMWFADHAWYRGYSDKIPVDHLLGFAAQHWPGRFNVSEIARFREQLRGGSFRSLIHAYHELLVLMGYKGWDPDDPEDAVCLANLGRFSQLLLDYEAATWRGGQKRGWPALLKGLAWFIQTFAQTAYGEQSPDDLPEVDAVQITTVHQAKGLEWPVVFVPALTNRRFPSSRAGRQQDWLLSRDLFDVERYEGGIEAERRLFFVATTRARDVLVLSRFQMLSKSERPSLFLDEVEPVPQCSSSLPVVGTRPRSAKQSDEVSTLAIQDIIFYLRCPYEYRLRRVWGYEPELVREMGLGRSVHHILRVLAEKAKRGIDPVAALKQTVDECFFMPFQSEKAMASIKPRVEKALLRYLARHADTLYRADEVETRMEFFLDQHATLVGRADVLVGDTGVWEVIDYKTSDDTRLYNEAELQVQLYSLGLMETGKPVKRARIMRVMEEGTSEQQVPVDSHHLQAAQKKAEACVDGILRRSFPPKRGTQCGGCDMRRICAYR